MRLHNTPESAWNVAHWSLGIEKGALLQRELVDMGKRLEKTIAGVRLYEESPFSLSGLLKRNFNSSTYTNPHLEVPLEGLIMQIPNIRRLPGTCPVVL